MQELTKAQQKLNRYTDREIDFHVLYSTFANNVKYIRRQLNMTQQQFAHMLDWKRSHLGMIEEGRSLDLKNVMVLAKMASVSIDTILLTDMRVPQKPIVNTELKNDKKPLYIIYKADNGEMSVECHAG